MLENKELLRYEKTTLDKEIENIEASYKELDDDTTYYESLVSEHKSGHTSPANVLKRQAAREARLDTLKKQVSNTTKHLDILEDKINLEKKAIILNRKLEENIYILSIKEALKQLKLKREEIRLSQEKIIKLNADIEEANDADTIAQLKQQQRIILIRMSPQIRKIEELEKQLAQQLPPLLKASESIEGNSTLTNLIEEVENYLIENSNTNITSSSSSQENGRYKSKSLVIPKAEETSENSNNHDIKRNIVKQTHFTGLYTAIDNKKIKKAKKEHDRIEEEMFCL